VIKIKEDDKMRHRILMVLLASVICIPAFYAAIHSQDQEEPEQISSDQLKQTIIAAHMEEEIEPGNNLIYCSTFQIAWNMLQDSIIEEEIELSGDPRIARMLNKQRSTAKDVSEDCYVAMVGELTEEFLQKINDALQEKFGDQAPEEVKEAILPNMPQIFSYAYLYKNLQFPHEFESLEKPVHFHSRDTVTDVKAFGIEKLSDANKELGEQVQVIEYEREAGYASAPKSFIVGLESKSENDQIILACVEPEANLLQTIQKVSQKVKKASFGSLKPDETLQIPKLDFNVDHSFSELTNREFLNEGWEGWFISKATQWIRFKLNEKGAVLKSEARIVMLKGPISRRFVFDKPFLIYLKQKDAEYPYFAMWVDNTELLMKE
jgi:hypothetical protein